MVLIFLVEFSLAYVLLSYLHALFFALPMPRFSAQRVRSVFYVGTGVVAAYALVLLTPDIELGNRIQHALGGGLLAAFLYYRVVRDSGLPLRRFQFFALTFLIVTALGVANELVEFFLQHTTSLVFATTLDDTWLDLFSNTAGLTLGALVCTLLLPDGR